ncbi:hypothetical protein Cpir12675_001938 [Ceratocystis pirilliformis]|uniref:Protein DGCR14 n=1 Tax=Ceratocystis pirilliformis TaxID=259994 RepID=A0ABR3ZF15_9PEZI
MASPDPQPSKALVRKRDATVDMQLMAPPPPPAKKIKRPKKVLDEESYTEGLSQIIMRDFFPGLQEIQLQNDYLDAVEAKDRLWISTATHNLIDGKTPDQKPGLWCDTPSSTRRFVKNETPSTILDVGTPASIAPSIGPSSRARVNTAMRLSQFQATYTSEDNESFYALADRQNQKKTEKQAWLWNGNKFDSKQLIKQKEVQQQLSNAGQLHDDGFMKKDRLAIKDSDDRPAQPELWKWRPKNTLMFTPDGIEDQYETRFQRAEASSTSAPKGINYHNTRVPTRANTERPLRPPSPTLTAVRDALAGNVPQTYKTPSEIGSTLAGGETPRINGYAFVDDEDDEGGEDEHPLPKINLGPGDATPSPFRLQERTKKEDLLHRMVDRINKSHHTALRNGFTGKADATPIPKFMNSPRASSVGSLTPAAQRLLGKIGASQTPARGSTQREGRTHSSFASSTPMASRGFLTKRTPKPK